MPARSPTHDRATQPPAFSLVEMVTVLVLTGVLAAVAIPTMSSLNATRAAIAANQVLRDVTLARERASSTGCRTWMVFSTPTNSYSVLAEPIGSPGRANALTLADPASGLTYTQSLATPEFAGVSLMSAVFDSGSEVGFDWLGRSLNSTSAPLASPGIVTLTGGHTVTVCAGTGLATVP